MAATRSSRAIVRFCDRALAPTPAAFNTARSSYCLARPTYSKLSTNVGPPASLTQFSRSFSVQRQLREQEAPSSSGIPPPKSYAYQEIHDLVTDPQPNRILIDVREPSELLQTGRIPTAKAVPVSSAPDAFFMSEEDFETKFGFPRPTEQDEVIFYCKAGVRSRQAALMAAQARPPFGGKFSNYNGSWLDWQKNGGGIEQEGEQGEDSALGGATNPQGVVPGTPRP
ncbi:Thiosulfate sulfurtransferase rdl2, mitochondrial [Exophiala xenobiotica]|uniref:Thiosulfate sulfurtransferase rdl2, mitochondrial n=1 Tax=Lithohypha guttulata TaxID=1690604 RepID=A0ABR0K2B7_9EURO|nr:Thiosulfate sulfurtransferase rdl2, mitochondrial [Lithohypha guttulata]KAK5312579.1 Thiosulfate sulfurtransferase rdl2, mitochondrial [Exophiala xenobiotica]